MPISLQNPQVREDQVFLRRMRQPDFRVLVDIKESEIQKVVQDKGSVITPCADGDRIYELMTHHHRVCEGAKCHHTPALNGGPLLFSDSSQLSEEMREDGNVLLRHAFEGREIKGVETFICYGHAPCGKAILNGIRVDQLIGHYLRGKDRVSAHAKSNQIPLKAIGLWIHINWTKLNEERTYVLKRAAWMSPEVTEFRGRWQAEPKYRELCVERYWDDSKFWSSQSLAA